MAVYAHRDPTQWLRQLEGARIHRADAIDVNGFEPAFIKSLAEKLTRRMAFALTVADRHLLVALDEGTFEGGLTRHELSAR